MRRRAVLAAGLATPAIAPATTPGIANAALPPGPVRVVVPFAPGGAIDAIGRALAAGLAERTRRGFVVENRAGAGGTIGADAVARAAPDGATLLVSEIGANAAAAAVFANLPYDPVRAFAHLTIAVLVPVVVAVNPAVAPSFPALLARAREEPGRLTYASGGVGNAAHLFAADLCRRAGVEMTHVPYRGGGPIMAALLSGEADLSVMTLATALPQLRAGALRALAVGDASPHPLLPEVSPVAATLPGWTAAAWHGLHAPSATPAAVADALAAEARAVCAAPAMRAWMAARGFSPSPAAGREEAAAFVAAEAERWTAVARAAGVRPE